MLASAASPAGCDLTLSTNGTSASTIPRPFGKAFHRDVRGFDGGHKHNGTFAHLSTNTTRAHGHADSWGQSFGHAQDHHRHSPSKFSALGGFSRSVVLSHDQGQTRKSRLYSESRAAVQTTYLTKTLYSTEFTESMRSTADPVSRLASTSTQHSQMKTTSKAGHSNTASSTKSAKKTTLQAHSSKNNPVKTTSSRYWHTTSSPSNRATAAHHNATDHKAERTRHAATATETSKSASSNAFLSALAKSALSAHNDLRAKHNATALTWSTELAVAAQTWANKCDFKHGGGVALGSGENIAAYKNAAGNVTYAVDLWAAEASGYDYADPGYADATGHFTQMVWKATTQLGCAQAHCTPLTAPTWTWDAGYFFVCEYLEAGNLVGTTAAQTADYFSANVQE
ncbi:hypothetical protein JCM1841_004860 [Sporobolomyces salmonicolor]